MAISGVALGAVATGSVFVYAGLKGYSIPEAIQAVVQGKSPQGLTQRFPITTPTGSDTASSPAGSDDRSGGVASAGLVPAAKAAANEVVEKFGNPHGIGGKRNEPGSDHHTGHAIDVMVSGGGKAAAGSEKARGDAIANWAIANAKRLNVKYIIWRKRIWAGSGGWRTMADRGSDTQNHFDHVHISFN